MGPSLSPQPRAPTTPHVALSDPVPRGDLTPRSPAAASDHGTARAADPPSTGHGGGLTPTSRGLSLWTPKRHN